MHGPRGEIIGIELKSWTPTLPNITRAAEIAKQYSVATGSDIRVAIPGLKKSNPEEGVFAASEVVDAIVEEFHRGGWKPPGQLVGETITESPTVFAAMPFDRRYDDVYLQGIRRAAKAIGAGARRVDKFTFDDETVAQIKAEISRAVLVIADVSEARPNVLYEVGYADALGRPVAHICSTPLNELPFDIRNWPTLSYTLGAVGTLIDPLIDRCRDLMKQRDHPLPKRPPRQRQR